MLFTPLKNTKRILLLQSFLFLILITNWLSAAPVASAGEYGRDDLTQYHAASIKTANNEKQAQSNSFEVRQLKPINETESDSQLIAKTANMINHLQANNLDRIIGISIDNSDAITLESYSSGTTSNLIQNPSFENGVVPWVEYTSPSHPIIMMAPATVPAHTGMYMAALGGKPSGFDIIHQQVTIPENATSATLEFWYQIVSLETKSNTIYDFFYGSDARCSKYLRHYVADKPF